MGKDTSIKDILGRNFEHFHRNKIFTLRDLENQIVSRGLIVRGNSIYFNDPPLRIRNTGKVTWYKLLNELKENGFDWTQYRSATSALERIDASTRWQSRVFPVHKENGQRHPFEPDYVTEWLNEISAETFVIDWVFGNCVVYAKCTR